VKDLIDVAKNPDRESESLQEAIDAVLAYEPDGDDGPPYPPKWLRGRFEVVRSGRVEDHPDGGVVLFAGSSSSDQEAEPDFFADDDDLLSASGRGIPLADHTASVERAVGALATRCLPQEFLGPLLHAARWHDVGKLDERFQLVLRQGDEIANLGKPLAKSAFVPTSPARREFVRTAAGLPKGFRHEMLSLQLVERRTDLAAGAQATILVLHLIASHHGHARPFAPLILDPEPPTVSGCHSGEVIALDATDRKQLVEPYRLGSGVPDRFWRLTRRYGWWGLAYLEAMLRLGDWYGSEHVVENTPQRSALLQSSQQIDVHTATSVDDPLVLTGLDGTNPLGFLAALGTLLVLRRGAYPQTRLGWRRTITWQPVLTGGSLMDRNALCHAIAASLRGRPVADDAEDKRMAAQKDFDAAKKALKDKRDEIKERRLRGKDRQTAVDTEIAPLEHDAHRKRSVWLDALRDAIPSPELALGKHIDCTSDEYREYATSFLKESGIAACAPLDLLAAFASDMHVEKSGRVSATPFCFITGSGHQYFLDTVRQLMKEATADRIRSVLFEPWRYADEKLSLRWDPMEDRRYALMDRDPTASDNKSRTVWMANLLAYRALALFTSAPEMGSLETTGWRETRESMKRRKEAKRLRQDPPSWREMEFTWPVWEHPAGPHTIRSYMLLPDLGAENPDRSAVRARGVMAIFRSRRIKVGSGATFKINFEPARDV
jgi:hypothetical protein